MRDINNDLENQKIISELKFQTILERQRYGELYDLLSSLQINKFREDPLFNFFFICLCDEHKNSKFEKRDFNFQVVINIIDHLIETLSNTKSELNELKSI